MKKFFLLFIALLFLGEINAKKVKFSVDMGTHTVSPNGVHIVGDFQSLAGFGPDWDPAALVLTQVGSSSIYEVIVSIPAFRKYEYLFVNGNQTYEAEFVPEASRVGYNFVDNRWIYIDSLSNDTMNIGAIRFGENAPAGKVLVRYLVDLSDAAGISANGIHVGTNYQSTIFDPSKIRLYSFGNYVFEIINYVDTALFHTVNYIFYNGNSSLTTESVPMACQSSGKRSIAAIKDTVLRLICFSSCTTCLTVGIKELSREYNSLILFPNPASSYVTILNETGGEAEIEILNATGEKIESTTTFEKNYELNLGYYSKGIYFIRLTGANGVQKTSRLIRI